MTLSIDAVMSAMANYAEAQSLEKEARYQYEGYSCDYHGARYIEAVNSAKKQAETALQEYVDHCVGEALKKAWQSRF